MYQISGTATVKYCIEFAYIVDTDMQGRRNSIISGEAAKKISR